MDIVSAHDNDHRLGACDTAGLLDMKLMSPVQGIVFGDDAGGFFHIAPQKIQFDTPYSTIEMLEIQGNRGYNNLQ